MDSQAPELSAILLAGGGGRRMGFPKLFLRLDDRPVLELMMERLRPVCGEFIVVVSQKLAIDLNNVAHQPETDVRRIEEFQRILAEQRAVQAIDVQPDKGPLSGLVSGLRVARSPWSFVAGCDAPLVSPLLARNMLQYAPENDIVVPEREGRLQPLQALYRREAVEPVASERLMNGNLKLMDLLKEGGLRVHTIPEAEWAGWGVPESSFANLNTPDDVSAVSLPSDRP